MRLSCAAFQKCRQGGNPPQKLIFPRTAFGRALMVGGSETMAARAILQVEVGNIAQGECRVEEFGIVVLDDRVILAVDEEHGRAVGRHMAFERERVAQLAVVLAAVAEQCPA